MDKGQPQFSYCEIHHKGEVAIGRKPECCYCANIILRKENERLIEALKLAKEKLIIYRNNSKGDYLGGVEYVNLISIIEQALNREPGV